MLGEGKLTLTAVSLLVKHLTPDNHVQLLTEAQGKPESEFRWWLSELFPEALPPEWSKKGKERVIPLDGETGKFILLVDRDFIEKLNRAKKVHKHQVPDGNALEILKHALTEDLKHHDPKEKAKRVRFPRKRNPKIETRSIPAGIERTVRERGQHQCSFVSKNEVRCAEKGGLELDHIRPWALGGVGG